MAGPWEEYQKKPWEEYAPAPSADLAAPTIASPVNPIEQEIRQRATAGLAGVPGGSPNVVPASDKAVAIAAGGIGLAGAAMYGRPALLALKALAEKHPSIARIVEHGIGTGSALTLWKELTK